MNPLFKRAMTEGLALNQRLAGFAQCFYRSLEAEVASPGFTSRVLFSCPCSHITSGFRDDPGGNCAFWAAGTFRL